MSEDPDRSRRRATALLRISYGLLAVMLLTALVPMSQWLDLFQFVLCWSLLVIFPISMIWVLIIAGARRGFLLHRSASVAGLALCVYLLFFVTFRG